MGAWRRSFTVATSGGWLLLLAGCGGGADLPPTAIAPPVVASRAPLTPSPPAALVQPSRVPPTTTPAPVLPLRITAQLDPPTPRAGMDFVVNLTITNDGERAAHGVYIATSGPWERWTVLDITPPDATFARDAAGWRVLSRQEVPARQSALIAIHVRADSPSEDQLTFAVREAEPGEIR